ncbi:MAG: prepilin peptidase [Lachnospiraceae bacterium]|nr:prepilin peptidase [Lachnospiraceae bacterium]MDY4970710.1 prepilin peptidase [Lachnospiraceae bacterium]
MKNCIYILLIGMMIGSMIVCTVEDIRKKQIHMAAAEVFITASMMAAWYEQREWTYMASGAVLGLLFLLISICTHERIGKGDGFLILGTGVYMGFWASFMIVFAAMLLVCIYGLFVIKKKRGWKYEIPFAPFLAASYIMAVILQV